MRSKTTEVALEEEIDNEQDEEYESDVSLDCNENDC
jgi:hypothetical protein